MFGAPPEIPTRVFARLPGEFRRVGQDSEWAKVQRGGAKLHSFLEGPSFDRAGNLYVGLPSRLKAKGVPL